MGFGNLLNQALGAIPPKSVVYKKFIRNTTSASGILIPIYEEEVSISNSIVQPVPKESYEKLGLDLKREYRNVWISADVASLSGQLSNDVLYFDNRTWNIWGDTVWETYDGWNKLLVVAEKER